MSLCLAATCALDESRQAIVYCCDRAGTRGSVQSEDIDKVRRVGSATVLLAGNNSEAKQLLSRLASEKNITGGLALSRYYPDRANEFLVCVTEMNSRTDIDALVAGLASIALTV